MQDIISGVEIAGIAAVVPKTIRNPVSDQGFFSQHELEKLAESTGVINRRVLLPEENICTSDLCYQAARRLLDQLKWSAESIDALIFISQTPDYFLPPTACVLHERLGLEKHCIAFDINLGCSGYVYGLYILSSLMRSGCIKKSLLLVGDTISKIASYEDRSVFPLFGDAGSATGLIYRPNALPMHFVLGTDGQGAQKLIVPAGAFREPITEGQSHIKQPAENGNFRARENLYMDGPEIFSFTLREVPSAVTTLLEFSGCNLDNFDGLVFHQANLFMLRYLQKKLKLNSQNFLISLDQYGNTSSASIPLTLLHCKEKNARKLLLAGFGVGFSWAMATVTLTDQVILLPIEDYQDPVEFEEKCQTQNKK